MRYLCTSKKLMAIWVILATEGVIDISYEHFIKILHKDKNPHLTDDLTEKKFSKGEPPLTTTGFLKDVPIVIADGTKGMVRGT